MSTSKRAKGGGGHDRHHALLVPPQALRDYAFLADGYRGAIIGPRGDVSWLCAPRWDSPAVLSNLVGGQGCYAVSPAGTYV